MTPQESYRLGCRLFENLRRVRSAHNGDFDEYLVLYCLILTAEYKDRTHLSGAKNVTVPMRGLNLLSIAEITGIPRETVRRKIVKLMQVGSVERQAGLYRYSGDDWSHDIVQGMLMDSGEPSAE